MDRTKEEPALKNTPTHDINYADVLAAWLISKTWKAIMSFSPIFEDSVAKQSLLK